MRNRKVGVIGIRGAWSTEALSAQLKKKNAGGEVLELNEIGYDLAHGRLEHRKYDLESLMR